MTRSQGAAQTSEQMARVILRGCSGQLLQGHRAGLARAGLTGAAATVGACRPAEEARPRWQVRGAATRLSMQTYER
jgi:hypothetical protein